MSQEQADYVIEAMNSLHGEPAIEIEAARTIITRKNGRLEEINRAAFIKLSTAFKSELPIISGDALKVWIFIVLSINRKSNRANPSLRTIAAGVGLAVNTVQKALKNLEENQLLTIDRNSRRYNLYDSPEYVSVNRAEISVSNPDTDHETVSKLNTTVSKKSETVSDSVILNQKNQKKPDLIDGILQYEISPKAIRDAIREHFRLTPNWETKYNREWMQWAMNGANVTPEKIRQAAGLWRADRRFNWAVPTLKGIQEHWLELTEPLPQQKESEYETINE